MMQIHENSISHSVEYSSFFLKILSIRILVSSSVLANRKQTVSSLHADNPTLLLGGKLFKTYVSSCRETLKLSYMFTVISLR